MSTTPAMAAIIEATVQRNGYRVGKYPLDSHVRAWHNRHIIPGMIARAKQEMGEKAYARFMELNPTWRGY